MTIDAPLDRAAADARRRRRPAAAGADRAAAGQRRAPGDVGRPGRPRRATSQTAPTSSPLPGRPVAHRLPGRSPTSSTWPGVTPGGRAGGLADRAAHRRPGRHERRARRLRHDPAARRRPWRWRSTSATDGQGDDHGRLLVEHRATARWSASTRAATRSPGGWPASSSARSWSASSTCSPRPCSAGRRIAVLAAGLRGDRRHELRHEPDRA